MGRALDNARGVPVTDPPQGERTLVPQEERRGDPQNRRCLRARSQIAKNRLHLAGEVLKLPAAVFFEQGESWAERVVH